jgi:hypothetical protein
VALIWPLVSLLRVGVQGAGLAWGLCRHGPLARFRPPDEQPAR